MYAVVGCSECTMLWIVEGRPERSSCPRCGASRKHKKRKQFVTTDDENHAREVRASMLAARSGHSDAFGKLDSFAELGDQATGIDDTTYLEGSGIDADEVAAAGKSDTTTQSRQELIREALRELDEPTETAVVTYATERGVPAEYTKRALSKLAQRGEVSEHRGVYRLL